MMTFKVVRVFVHNVDGVPQVSAFPDEVNDPPKGTTLLPLPADPTRRTTDMFIRVQHFTEIENFSLFGRDLAHEAGQLDNELRPVSTIQNLTVPNPDVQAHIDAVKSVAINSERLGDLVADVGLNWEHAVASFNNLLIPGNPLKVSDPVLQDLIDSLDDFTEALVNEVNLRAMKAFKVH